MISRAESRVSSGLTESNERRAGERRKDKARWVAASDGGAVMLYEDVQCMDLRRLGEVPVSDRSREHGPVTFWTPDGSHHAGTTPRMSGEILFIESDQMVPVGTDLTVSFAPLEGQSAVQEIAEGTVVWHCPRGDEFKHHGGVGVRITRRWPKGPGLVGGPKEPA